VQRSVHLSLRIAFKIPHHTNPVLEDEFDVFFSLGTSQGTPYARNEWKSSGKLLGHPIEPFSMSSAGERNDDLDFICLNSIIFFHQTNRKIQKNPNLHQDCAFLFKRLF